MSLRRNDITVLREQYGLEFAHVGDVLTYFEKVVAEFFGAPEAVAVDCCTHALELALRVQLPQRIALVPLHTYMSVPMTLNKLGIEYEFTSKPWLGYYNLVDNIYDAATLWKANSYIPGSMKNYDVWRTTVEIATMINGTTMSQK
jgi:hypothetical protein